MPVLVAPGDPEALARAAGRVLTDPGLAGRLSTAGVTRAAGLPAEDDTVSLVTGLYNEFHDLDQL